MTRRKLARKRLTAMRLSRAIGEDYAIIEVEIGRRFNDPLASMYVVFAGTLDECADFLETLKSINARQAATTLRLH